MPCLGRGAGEGGVLWLNDGDSGGVRFVLDPILGVGTGGPADLGSDRLLLAGVSAEPEDGAGELLALR